MKSFIKVFPRVVLLVLTMFFSGCAVSKTPNYPNLEKIEMKEDEMHILFKGSTRQQILEKLSAIGFDFISLDLEGFRSGKLNRKRT